MASYDIAYQLLMPTEGGYSNDPADSGGETYRGISRRNFPNWPGWRLVDQYKSKTNFQSLLDKDVTLQTLVKQFYKQEMWDYHSLDTVRYQDIANEVFDTSVNMGKKIGGTFLQRSLNVANINGKYYKDLEVDGHIGSMTIKALHLHPTPRNILKALNALQGARYIEICENNPSQEKFFNGWMKRVNEYCDK